MSEEQAGTGTSKRNLAGIVSAILLFIYGGLTIINLQMAMEDIGTYIYGNALLLFLFTGLPAIVIGLILVVLVYRRR